MTCRHDGNRRSFRSVETQLTGMVRTCPVLLAVVVALAASGSVDAGIAQTVGSFLSRALSSRPILSDQPVTPATSRFVVAFVFVEAMKSLSSSPSKLRTLSNAVTSAALHRVILRSLPKSALMIGGALTVHHLTKVARQFRVGIDGMVQRDRTQSKLEVTKRALKLALLRPGTVVGSSVRAGAFVFAWSYLFSRVAPSRIRGTARIAGAAFGALPLVTRKVFPEARRHRRFLWGNIPIPVDEVFHLPGQPILDLPIQDFEGHRPEDDVHIFRETHAPEWFREGFPAFPEASSPRRPGTAMTFVRTTTTTGIADDKSVYNSTSCTICLETYSQNDTIGVLPDCGHHFHHGCVGKWLETRSDCPICRRSVIPARDSQSSQH
ncbi:hypothetical protein PBRA_008289 [Plasmodiophora brassicae]|uniref:RING-type domain-containing protein n=1 Tax=Plasmodiophora brassicae TaxID=37360 RepID=A0A0G4J0D6_PLABS|nr:hypothetical protein PBRA_008289 [Plasmodiophora brassicae]